MTPVQCGPVLFVLLHKARAMRTRQPRYRVVADTIWQRGHCDGGVAGRCHAMSCDVMRCRALVEVTDRHSGRSLMAFAASSDGRQSVAANRHRRFFTGGDKKTLASQPTRTSASNCGHRRASTVKHVTSSTFWPLASSLLWYLW